MNAGQVREVRTALGLTQVQFAARLGVSDKNKTFISEFERGHKPPTPLMEQLYDAFMANGHVWANIVAQPYAPFSEIIDVPEELVEALKAKPKAPKLTANTSPVTAPVSAVTPIEPKAKSIESKVIKAAMNAQGLVVVHEDGGALLMFTPGMLKMFRGMGDTTEIILTDLGPTTIIELEDAPEDVIAQLMATATIGK